MFIPTRRRFITLATSLLAAPAIVRVSSIMPVKALPLAEPVRDLAWLKGGGNWMYWDESDFTAWLEQQNRRRADT